MGFYDAFKDVLNIAQKADNVELYKQLLDLSSQALELQAENAKLRDESAELKKVKDLEENIEYHVDPYITRKSDTQPIKYCAACWASKKALIALQNRGDSLYTCTLCRAKIYCINIQEGQIYR